MGARAHLTRRPISFYPHVRWRGQTDDWVTTRGSSVCPLGTYVQFVPKHWHRSALSLPRPCVMKESMQHLATTQLIQLRTPSLGTAHARPRPIPTKYRQKSHLLVRHQDMVGQLRRVATICARSPLCHRSSRFQVIPAQSSPFHRYQSVITCR